MSTRGRVSFSPPSCWLLIVFVLLATGAMSCGIVVSFDEYGLAQKSNVALHGIQGTADGLGDAKVTLRVRDALIEVGDGPFSFPATVSEGAAYAVSVVADPAGHACTVENGSGIIATADAQGVAVHCPSTIATLRMLTISAAPLFPVFQPGTADYFAVSGFLGPRATAVTATASDARARISVKGVMVASGQASADFALVTGPNPIDVTVTAADGRTQTHYTIVVSVNVTSYVKASNTQSTASFGVGIAVSGNTLAVGSPGESSSAKGVDADQTSTSSPGAGAVYVFTRAGSTWSQQAYLKASNTRGPGAGSSGALFGAAVALSGDTLVVGAPKERSVATGIDGDQYQGDGSVEAGAAYVFTRTGTAWSQQAYVKPSNNGYGQGGFGRALALTGDTLAIGAPFESSCGRGVDGDQTLQVGGLPACPSAGAVYVFARAGTTWSQQAYIKASNARGNEGPVGALFGTSVALFDDRLAVGSSGESSNSRGINGDQTNTASPSSGAVYVFRRFSATWSQEAYVKASNTCKDPNSAGPGYASCGDAQFGRSLALSGDTLAVAAPGESSSATGINGNQSTASIHDSGAAYVFRRIGTTWSQEAYVKAPNNFYEAGGGGPRFGGPGINDLGQAIAIDGDTLAVGAFFESGGAAGPPPADAGSAGPGAVYVFHRSGTTWMSQAYVRALLPRPSSWFGGTVALAPGGSLFVGAEGESSHAKGVNGDQTDVSLRLAGAVYVY